VNISDSSTVERLAEGSVAARKFCRAASRSASGIGSRAARTFSRAPRSGSESQIMCVKSSVDFSSSVVKP